MTTPTDPRPGARARGENRAPLEDQKTLLLADSADAAPAPEAPVFYGPPSALVGLSAAEFAAVSRRYQIVAAAGHGSTGNVFKALDRETGETIALKILKPEIASDQAMIERFKNEMLFARRITHKNVCRVHEFNRIGAIAYTSMEFVDGESLRSVLNRFGGLPPRKSIDILQQMCAGLKEAHAQGIVHRDLKPENIMIDAQGNVKIMDFGIARSMEATATRLTGSMVGTPAYMAPEQAAGKPVDYRTDIYSLGLIAYEIFTGTPTFRADNAVAVALKQMQEAPQPPHELDPNISPMIERVILKCLEKDPARRYQTIAEVESAFRVPGAPVAPAARTAPAAAEFAPGIPAAEAPLRAARHLTPPPHGRSVAAHVLSWLVLLASLGGAGYAARRWVAPVALPNLYSIPATPAPPEPPDFALQGSPAQTTQNASAETAPAAASDSVAPAGSGNLAAPATSATKQDAEQAASEEDLVPPTQPVPTVAAHPKSTPRGTAAEAAPPDAGSAAGDQPARASSEASDPASSTASPGYVWAGRYEFKDRADSAAKEIRDLGLPALVLPRTGQRGPFFIVVTGPFAPKRAADVKDLLQADGFANARSFKVPQGAGGPPPSEAGGAR
jgi:hypothetical protein